MNASQHFIISFASSILVGIVMSAGVFIWYDKLLEWEIQPLIVVPIVFAVGHFAVRWFFKIFVAVRCPYGCGQKGHPIPGRNDRFRCYKCGNDF